MDIKDEILTSKDAAEKNQDAKRLQWDAYEKLFHNQLADAISNKTKSSVFDPKLATLVLERSYRVMAQLATGKAKGISKNDIGSGLLMDLIIDKYVNRNANAQFDLLTKFRMIDMYSNIYGVMYALVDWDIKRNGYVGPDLWMLPIRDVFIPAGSISASDAEKVIIRTWQPLSFFERIAKQKREGYKNLSEIVTKLKDKSGTKQDRDAQQKTEREKDKYPNQQVPRREGFFEVLTQYEGDRWAEVCVDADLVFRDTKNPHDNGEIPVVEKYSIPLLDDPAGMGDFERGYSMQQVINSSWNLYLDGIKLTTSPPVILNKENMAVPSSFSMTPGAKWIGRGNIANVANPINLNPQGISSFNNTFQAANGSLLNLFGTTDTTVTQQLDAGFGKTPQALKMQNQRENTRDNADRFFMEQFLQKVYKKMVNLISKKQSSAIAIRMFQPEIEDLARTYPDIKEMYDEKTGKLTIDKKKTGSTMYDYEIVSGSTYSLDEKSQQENLSALLQMFIGNPQIGMQIRQMLEQEGYEVKIGEMVKRAFSKSGIQDWNKLIVEKTPVEQVGSVLNAHNQQFQQALQQAMTGGMNQTPADPTQQMDQTQMQQQMGGMNG